jgi:Protein of unknown function (DUF2914)
MRRLSAGFVLLLALAAAACGKADPPGMSREPLAHGKPAAPAPAAPAPAKAPEEKAAPDKASEPEAQKGVKSTTKQAEAQKPEATPKSSALSSEVRVKRLVVTRAIDQREPVQTASFSPSDEPVFAFVELDNPSSDAGEVVVTFEHEGGKSVGHVRLEVPAKNKRWRTWGRTRFIREAGTWSAVVRTPDGTELARKSFEVQ